jgi:hypothetical protein
VDRALTSVLAKFGPLDVGTPPNEEAQKHARAAAQTLHSGQA